MITRVPPTTSATCDPTCIQCPIAHDPDSDETWTLDELIAHANGCEEQIDYLWAKIKAMEALVLAISVGKVA